MNTFLDALTAQRMRGGRTAAAIDPCIARTSRSRRWAQGVEDAAKESFVGHGHGGASGGDHFAAGVQADVSPSGMRRTRSPRKPTTSAITFIDCRSEVMRHSSPSPTLGPIRPMTRPVMATVNPPNRAPTGACTAPAVRRASMSGMTRHMAWGGENLRLGIWT